MRIFFISVFIFIIILSFGIKLILIMSYTDFDVVMRKKNALINSTSFIERNMAKFFYFFIERCYIFGGLGIIGFLVTLIIN